MKTNHEDTKETKVCSPAQAEAYATRVIGCAIEVHRALGPGFLECVYEEALALELALRRIPFTRQHKFAVTFKGVRVGEGRLDFLVGDELIVELKAVELVAPVHLAQVVSYLKATDLELGLILNFKAATMREGIKRVRR